MAFCYRNLRPDVDFEVYAILPQQLKNSFGRVDLHKGFELYYSGPDGVIIAEAGLKGNDLAKTLGVIEARDFGYWEHNRVLYQRLKYPTLAN